MLDIIKVVKRSHNRLFHYLNYFLKNLTIVLPSQLAFDHRTNLIVRHSVCAANVATC